MINVILPLILRDMNIQTIIVAFIPAIFSILAIYVKHRLDTKKPRITEDIINNTIHLDKICFIIRKTLNADGVFIAQYHNGGKYLTGLNMLKYTVISEDCNVNINTYRNISDKLVNNISYLIHRLIVDSKYICENVNSNLAVDRYYKDKLLSRNIQNAYTFAVVNPINHKHLGFISVEYQKDMKFENVRTDIILKYLPDIINRMAKL